MRTLASSVTAKQEGRGYLPPVSGDALVMVGNGLPTAVSARFSLRWAPPGPEAQADFGNRASVPFLVTHMYAVAQRRLLWTEKGCLPRGSRDTEGWVLGPRGRSVSPHVTSSTGSWKLHFKRDDVQGPDFAIG